MEKQLLQANLVGGIGLGTGYSGARTIEAACEFIEHAAILDEPALAQSLQNTGITELASCDIGSTPSFIATKLPTCFYRPA